MSDDLQWKRHGCSSLSRSGKGGPHTGHWLPVLQTRGPRLFLAFRGGEMICSACDRLSQFECSHPVREHRENVHLFLVRQSTWLDEPGLFVFCTPPPSFSHLQCTSYPPPFHFECFHPAHAPAQSRRARAARWNVMPWGRTAIILTPDEPVCMAFASPFPTKPRQQFLRLFLVNEK